MKKSVIGLTGVTTAVLMALSINVHAIEASKVTDNGNDGHKAKNVVDNKLSTRWSDEGNDGSERLQFEFSETPNLTAINIAFYKGNSRSSYFQIESSEDGSDWNLELSAVSSGETKNLETFELNNVITAPYVRIVGLGNSRNKWNSITEVTFTESEVKAPIIKDPVVEIPVIDEPIDATPINASVTASSDDGHIAENVLDSRLDTRWSAKGNNEWLRIDLGSEKSLDNVQIAFLKGNSREAIFELEVSRDGSDWITIIEDGESSGDTNELEKFEFNEVSARYVRYVGHGNSKNQWNSITEFVVIENNNGVLPVDTIDPILILPNEPTDGTEPVDTIDPILLPSLPVGTSDDCEGNGQMESNGQCVDWLDIYESEHGEVGENDHLISYSPIEMKFSALEAQHETSNGNGWRHELKIKSSGDYRVGMTEVYEEFKARIKVDLSDGSKTIVAQHHADNTDTITKLYVADLDEGGFDDAPDGTKSDSKASNGIFDVYIRLAKEDGSGETKHLLTTIKSGESFDFEEINDHGKITVKINGQALPSITVNDSSKSYFKFGNYHQAQYPQDDGSHEVGDKIKDKDDWPEFYAKYFSKSEITFTNMSYIRNVD